MSKRQYQTVKFTGEFICIIGRVLRSLLFNILIFFLGFSFSYIFVVSNIQLKPKKGVDVKFVLQLEKDIEQQKQLIKNLEKQIEEYKQQLSHDPVSIAEKQ